jgi:hypothetical protein
MIRAGCHHARAPLSVETPAPRDPHGAEVPAPCECPRWLDIAPLPKQPAREFTFTADKSDDEAACAELLRLRARGLAR